MDDRLGCVYLKGTTDDEVEHNLTRGTGTLQQGDLSIGELFAIERLETVQGRVNLVRGNHSMALCTERFSWLLRRFYLSGFSSDYLVFFMKSALTKTKFFLK